MAGLQLSIPTTSVANAPGKPHTVYHVVVRLPLRQLTVKKRYSDFVDLHGRLATLAGAPPPLAPPPKHYFASTLNNPVLTEERRAALERYLLAILDSPDPRWRDSPPWRTFLALPASWSGGGGSSSGAASRNGSAATGGGGVGMPSGPITDPALWLDSHREVRQQLHDARLFLSKRDQAAAAAEQHEASAAAKRCLVKAGSLISALDSGLRESRENARRGSGGEKRKEITEGELRRRKDLVAAARKEKEGLESLANELAARKNSVPAGAVGGGPGGGMSMEKTALFAGSSAGGASKKGGRVLGAPQETARTRELDNPGVLQLQKQIFKEQDQSLESLLSAVRRQKEMGLAIGEELQTHIEIMDQLEQDVERVDAKTRLARKRADKIS